ncbi:DUF4105 domain-containing protein [Dysgonomonas sp. OttesenSCG-928-M03]|nr:DUF4105 domain-containing protein [Dysgonomonas sp. OttesenSCG-928-M03]
MRLLLYKILVLIILIFGVRSVDAQSVQLSDSAKISLLTNTPWDGAIYALFGHTAIRICDQPNNIDLAFNYGLFDFNSQDFMYRFVKGKTDYSVGAIQLNRYLFDYQMKGVGIKEQILNLSQSGKQNLYDALINNCLPQNRIYRYNYFYDNCTTRARDMIENNIVGSVIYDENNKGKFLTYRKLVHECVDSQPWVRFGIDLVIGADADKPITERQEHFLPAYLMRAFDRAVIENPDGSTRKLVQSEYNLLEPTSQSNGFTIVDYPLFYGIILLTVSILVSYLSYFKKKKALGKFFDTLLFLSAGIAGSIIFFLMYFSIHPCTNPNWNLVWLNPVQLVFAFLFLIKFFSKSVYYYHFINFVLLIVFLLAWFLIPQYLELAFIPYILTLVVRSGVNVLEYRSNK